MLTRLSRRGRTWVGGIMPVELTLRLQRLLNLVQYPPGADRCPCRASSTSPDIPRLCSVSVLGRLRSIASISTSNPNHRHLCGLDSPRDTYHPAAAPPSAQHNAATRGLQRLCPSGNPDESRSQSDTATTGTLTPTAPTCGPLPLPEPSFWKRSPNPRTDPPLHSAREKAYPAVPWPPMPVGGRPPCGPVKLIEPQGWWLGAGPAQSGERAPHLSLAPTSEIYFALADSGRYLEVPGRPPDADSSHPARRRRLSTATRCTEFFQRPAEDVASCLLPVLSPGNALEGRGCLGGVLATPTVAERPPRSGRPTTSVLDEHLEWGSVVSQIRPAAARQASLVHFRGPRWLWGHASILHFQDPVGG